MIATVSPTAEAAAETERTLRFGCRATYVRNRSQRPATDTARPDTLFSGKEEEMLAAARDAVLGGKDGDEGPFFNGCVEVPLAPCDVMHAVVPREPEAVPEVDMPRRRRGKDRVSVWGSLQSLRADASSGSLYCKTTHLERIPRTPGQIPAPGWRASL